MRPPSYVLCPTPALQCAALPSGCRAAGTADTPVLVCCGGKEASPTRADDISPREYGSGRHSNRDRDVRPRMHASESRLAGARARAVPVRSGHRPDGYTVPDRERKRRLVSSHPLFSPLPLLLDGGRSHNADEFHMLPRNICLAGHRRYRTPPRLHAYAE